MLRASFRPDRRICRIDFSAFVAIITAVLTLLVWATPTGFPHDGVFVELPKSSHALDLSGARRDDALLIAVFRDGQVFLDSQRIAPEDLTNKLLARLHAGAPRAVFIRADARARYRAIASVLDSIRSAGLTNVAFVTEQQR
jgi:biopolymer transport protein TolR